ncbi:hypothetical protein CDO73_04745 [Saccharibacillus sp. O23]|uniref:S-layer homology domain-containing protein n=1 Tax=Saccharibacillus sp. O23 TaxID=2009338 RepID=UPI000B4E754F|nr:S-layer homology domain-containing protein [Saccharibacillus sp. O23]OWR31793.1 hypothetical protein CDO73_04745 [Saccharibacillus sp. O23]
MLRSKRRRTAGKTFKLALAGALIAGSWAGVGRSEVSADSPTNSSLSSPGGVGSPNLWLRADRGISENSGEPVSTWGDRSAFSNDAFQGTLSSAPTYWNDNTHNVNFNPVLDFDEDYLKLDVNKLPLGKKARTVISVAKSDTLDGISYILAWGKSDPSAYTASGLLRNVSRAGLTPMNSEKTQTMYSPEGVVDTKSPYEQLLTWTGWENGETSNTARLYSKMKPIEDNKPGGFGQIGISKAWNTGSADGAIIGKVIPEELNANYWDGTILDVIVYDRALTDTERQRVSTYLAIKYGYTMTPGSGYQASYLDSQGTNIWNSDANATYTHRITAIGRDDSSDLNQKQAKSQEPGAILTAALGQRIENTNSANSNAFAVDRSFFIFGDNDGNTAYTKEIEGAQNSKLKRMERIHQVDKTGGVDDATITLKLETSQQPSAGSEQYYLAIGASEEFVNAKLLPLKSDGTITLNSGEFSDGSFFTFAHVDKTSLSAAVSSVASELSGGALKEQDYTPDSWSALQTKLTEAQNALGTPGSSQEQVDQALKNLNEAREDLKPRAVNFDDAVLEKGQSGSRIVVTLDRGVTFDGQIPHGFTVRVGSDNVPADKLIISVDPSDTKRVLIGLPGMPDLDLSNIDEVGIKYDQTVGNLKGLNGGSVSSFDKTAQSGLSASLQITKPDATSGIVPGDKPAFGGKIDPAADSVTVELLDDQGQPIPNAGGAAIIDPATGEWSFVSEAKLPPGTYTVSVTAKKGEEVSIKKRTFTVVDKSALKAREQAVTAENLNGASYTSSTWNELQTALTEARRVLDDPAASQAQIDAALNRLNTARTGLTAIPSNPGSGSPSPSIPPVTSAPQPNGPTKQIITVDVASGAEDLRDITKVELERTTATDGTLSDQVTFTPAKAKEAIDKALAKNDPTARILIPDSTDAVSRVNVDIPAETVELLKRNKIDLEIHNPNGLVVVPASSLEGREGSFYFRLVPVKNPQERQSVEQRAQTEQIVRQLSGSGAAQVVSRPMTIETNLSSRPVTLVLPLDGTKLPTNEQERAAFLKNLGVYIEHSDGTKEVVRGAVETIDSPAISGNKLGLRFGIAKFSTFTIVSLNANEGMHEAYIQGYTDGTLRPDNAVIRSEMAAMLARLGQLSGSGTANFPDLPQRFWARDLIGQVTEAGWMKGYVDGTFKPNGEITREEMASIVFNYLRLSQGDATGLFPDVRAGSWSGGIIAAVQAQGIMTGDNGKFYPTRPLTRAEAVTILNRLFERGPLHGAPAPAWPDLNASHWAYGDLIEAATTHGYADRSDGGEEWISAR